MSGPPTSTRSRLARSPRSPLPRHVRRRTDSAASSGSVAWAVAGSAGGGLQGPKAAAGTKATVILIDHGRPVTRTVTTGITANGMVEIKSGLKDGDQVLITIPTIVFGGGSGTNGQRTVNGVNGLNGGGFGRRFGTQGGG